MNILLYVTALLTAISIMTYARLSTFINMLTIRKETACYMGNLDRTLMNEIQQKRYASHHGDREEEEDEEEENEPAPKRTEATRKVNFILFLNQELRTQNDSAYRTLESIAKNLLNNLYKDQTFFKKAQESKPSPVDFLINRFMQISEGLEGKEAITTLDHFIGLDLQDPDLQEFFVKMLAGTEVMEEKSKKCPAHKKGYPSLLDFVEVNKKKNGGIKPIRIQLAPPQVIEAIFIDPMTVSEVLEMRKKLQKEAKKFGSTEQQVASNEFESLFKSRLPKNLDEKMFDFTITKTKI